MSLRPFFSCSGSTLGIYLGLSRRVNRSHDLSMPSLLSDVGKKNHQSISACFTRESGPEVYTGYLAHSLYREAVHRRMYIVVRLDSMSPLGHHSSVDLNSDSQLRGSTPMRIPTVAVRVCLRHAQWVMWLSPKQATSPP